MTFHKWARTGALVTLAAALLSACGGSGNERRGVPVEFDGRFDDETGARRSTIFDLFNSGGDPNTTIEVNRYIWSASLDVLNFLPVQSVDPFSGVISMGYGTPPGGGTAYRATVYVTDPALDARSLKVALATRSGPVSADTVRAVEDAILTRARQLRIRDGDL
ncbi:DUF3576 domain-containing protein [Roseicyclus sp. F158]|uniref:DUF3576 domain-containing protein n=1 Tax=Tropicimonas omnivorans TaxID=3075590 RepID=A0ABU3DBX4_9RHOB|nr:DUF3576 domain-containing protein [Roseicyclus sp. F158]MDT0681217.1 DUF3576 domain-containing protein [Roseicyclus sp. F158]